MNILFVTGANDAFFNTLLICLHSFAQRMPGHHLWVCDYGLQTQQAEFLRGLNVLMERPAALAAGDVFRCKAALLRYLRQNGEDIERYDAVVWLDGDLTLMDVSIGDFAAVVADMKAAGAAVAACGAPPAASIGDVMALFAGTAAMAPFAQAVAAQGIDPALPYLSSGLFACRAVEFLARWDEMTGAIEPHPLFEQNMFNLALRQSGVPIVALDCETWQAQGPSLDRVALRKSAAGERAAAFIGETKVKTLHATSPMQNHLLIAYGRLTVKRVELGGAFKLFMAEPLRMHQLEMLAQFVDRHHEALLRLGLCVTAARPAAGFEFVSLPQSALS
jgi:hypothetical protein